MHSDVKQVLEDKNNNKDSGFIFFPLTQQLKTNKFCFDGQV